MAFAIAICWFLVEVVKMLHIYAHVACWLYKLYMQCDGHIDSVIYISNLCAVFIVVWLITVTHICYHLSYHSIKYGIYSQFGGHICFWHTFGNNVKYVLQLVMFMHMFANLLDLYAHLAFCLCDLYVQCCSHFFSVIHATYMSPSDTGSRDLT